MQTAFVVLLLGYALVLEVTGRWAARRWPHVLRNSALQNAWLAALLAGLAGGRATYIALNWTAYHDDLAAWFSLTPQALHPLGGLLIGGMVALAVLRVRKQPLWPALDANALGLGLMMAVLALALLAEGRFFGRPSDLPWAVDLWGASRHPTQLYALLGSLLVLFGWFVWQRRAQPAIDGQAFLLIVGGNALVWLVSAFWQSGPALVLGQYRLVQVVAWAVLVSAALAWNWRLDTAATTPPSEADPAQTPPLN